jgi:hypothetical protein
VRAFGQGGCGEGGEGLGVVGVLDGVVVDVELYEEGLVPLAAQVAWRAGVGVLTVGEEVECLAVLLLVVDVEGDGALAVGV